MPTMKTLTIGGTTYDLEGGVTSVQGKTGDVVLTPADLKFLLPTDSASGAVASFPDGADGVPVEALSVAITPVQDLHGQSSPYPAGGGVNKLPPAAVGTHENNGITLESNGDGTYTIVGSTGSSSSNAYLDLTGEYTIESDDYLHIGNPVADGSIAFNLDKTGGGNITYPSMSPANRIVSLSSFAGQKAGRVRIYVVANHANINMTIKPMICKSSTAIDFAPYSNICPITGFSQAKIWRESTYDPTADPTLTIDLSGTRYGGSLDVKTGVLRVTHTMKTFDNTVSASVTAQQTGYYTFIIPVGSNGQTNDEAILCNISKGVSYDARTYGEEVSFVAGTNFFFNTKLATNLNELRTLFGATNCTIYYRLATPLSVQLTPAEMQTVLGQNNVWANCGDTSVQYRADIGLYIDKKTS